MRRVGGDWERAISKVTGCAVKAIVRDTAYAVGPQKSSQWPPATTRILRGKLFTRCVVAFVVDSTRIHFHLPFLCPRRVDVGTPLSGSALQLNDASLPTRMVLTTILHGVVRACQH